MPEKEKTFQNISASNLTGDFFNILSSQKEFQRRIDLLKKALEVRNIPIDLVIIAPPVLEKSDFGYNDDIDFIFTGTEEQRNLLYDDLSQTFRIVPYIIYIDEERMKEIKEELPDFYKYLNDRRGKFNLIKESVDSIVEDPEEKTNLGKSGIPREKKLKICKDFIDDVKSKIVVLGYSYPITPQDEQMEAPTSDESYSVTVDLLLDPVDEKQERNASDWIHIYLKWRYAEFNHICIDPSDVTLDFARVLAKRDPTLASFYKDTFGIEIA